MFKRMNDNRAVFGAISTDRLAIRQTEIAPMPGVPTTTPVKPEGSILPGFLQPVAKSFTLRNLFIGFIGVTAAYIGYVMLFSKPKAP